MSKRDAVLGVRNALKGWCKNSKKHFLDMTHINVYLDFSSFTWVFPNPFSNVGKRLAATKLVAVYGAILGKTPKCLASIALGVCAEIESAFAQNVTLEAAVAIIKTFSKVSQWNLSIAASRCHWYEEVPLLYFKWT